MNRNQLTQEWFVNNFVIDLSCVCIVRGQLGGSVLSFHHVGSRYPAPVVRADSTFHNLLSHLTALE